MIRSHFLISVQYITEFNMIPLFEYCSRTSKISSELIYSCAPVNTPTAQKYYRIRPFTIFKPISVIETATIYRSALPQSS
ncbi:hypothetical protein L873DRAFT_595280 [Choiromyces venosus 120613-1]|uniref:Uncharacterized protein n=1 Tax=Choiromyces venosus 120613-1 TaxID=1336337 RepID=A0A3N4JU35_9PEZI|nr:hypothetical protein L873DRAFT_595280 [Choiromyces venosus 120613-1]